MGLFKRSADERDQCNIEAAIQVDDRKMACRVINLSVDGAGLLFAGDVEDLPEHFILCLPVIDGCAHEQKVELRWRMGKRAGVRFARPIAQANAA